MENSCQRNIKLILFLSAISFTLCYRLPDSVIPEHYQLEIITNLGDENGKFAFTGKVWITVECVHDTNVIKLHSKNLTIDNSKAEVTDVSGTESKAIKISKSAFDSSNDNDFYVITLEKPLQGAHKYKIYLPFSGKLEDGLAGFYRSSYEEKNTKIIRYLATTQFEATDARRAFPCFDEPAMKATFQITIGHKDKYKAISNMPLESTEPIKEKPGWIWSKFENSVPMSTYLVAYIVSDFDYRTSPQLNNNVTFRIWSRHDAINQVDFAKSVGPKVLDFYEKFFNIPYPLPKQDMVAIPDFNAGAMENWGLITYREAYLLYDPDLSQTASQHDVASIIAHEIAHQWFGNLVTMKWWTDLWLNEGFATYMAAIAVEALFPQWNSLEEESVDNLLSVFAFDSLETSHPVSAKIGHPKEIDQIFDTIAYKKGSYLIRMMSLFLGEDVLRKGVSQYLEKHRYNNAEQDDLWDSLTEIAHKQGALPANLTVKTIMDTWTIQTGYPVIKVDRKYGKHSAEMMQSRFLRNNIKAGKSSTCWWVPISYTTSKELDFNTTKPKHWLPCTQSSILYEDFPADDEWVVLNVQSSGLYRVNYDEKNWDMLVKSLNSDEYDKIPVMNRVQLIDDSASLAWVGDLNYKTYFDIINYLKRENKYVPWKAALGSIYRINKQVKRTSFYGEFQVYMRNLLSPIYEKVGGLVLRKNTQDKLDAVKHQVQITARACRYNVANCVSDAQKIFEHFQINPKNKEIVPKDLRSIIYCTAVRHGGEKEWQFLWEQYLTSNVAAEKSTILSSLACTRELWLLQRYLEWTIKPDSGIRKQDYSSIFSSIAANDVGYFVAQSFLQDHLKEIYKNLSPNTRRLARYLSSLATQMTTEQEYDWIRNLTDTNKDLFKESKQGVDQSLETVRLNIQWQKKHYSMIKTLLPNTEELHEGEKKI